MSYFDRDGQRIGLWVWVDLSRDKTYLRVALDHVGDAEVSTVWLGLDHQYHDGPPLIFETMVFGGRMDLHSERYATEKEARAGHARILARVCAAKAGETDDV